MTNKAEQGIHNKESVGSKMNKQSEAGCKDEDKCIELLQGVSTLDFPDTNYKIRSQLSKPRINERCKSILPKSCLKPLTKNKAVSNMQRKADSKDLQKRNIEPIKQTCKVKWRKRKRKYRTQCAVIGCPSNRIQLVLRDGTTSFFVFPHPADAHRRQAWIDFTGRQGFQPVKKSMICMRHFEKKFILCRKSAAEPWQTMRTSQAQ